MKLKVGNKIAQKTHKVNVATSQQYLLSPVTLLAIILHYRQYYYIYYIKFILSLRLQLSMRS